MKRIFRFFSILGNQIKKRKNPLQFATFIFGVLGDYLGAPICRICSSLSMSVGLFCLIMVEEDEIFVQIAWPCIAIGGIVNHMTNMKNVRAIPAISSTLMTLSAGCFGASGSMTLIIDLILENSKKIRLTNIFLFLAIL